jgi:transposase-like protein
MSDVMCESIPRFHDEAAARQHFECLLWPNGPVCPHCGGAERNSRLNGKSHRPGLMFCGDCRSQFSVTVGTVFESSKVKLHKWAYAVHIMCSYERQMPTAKDLERRLEVSYKTALFMWRRIRMSVTRMNKLEIELGSDDHLARALLTDE